MCQCSWAGRKTTYWWLWLVRSKKTNCSIIVVLYRIVVLMGIRVQRWLGKSLGDRFYWPICPDWSIRSQTVLKYPHATPRFYKLIQNCEQGWRSLRCSEGRGHWSPLLKSWKNASLLFSQNCSVRNNHLPPPFSLSTRTSWLQPRLLNETFHLLLVAFRSAR